MSFDCLKKKILSLYVNSKIFTVLIVKLLSLSIIKLQGRVRSNLNKIDPHLNRQAMGSESLT